jgi:uncharacterized protein YegJ (DUF2314 family)
MSRWLVPVILAAALLINGCDNGTSGEAKVTQRDSEPDIIQIDDNDPRMIAATAEARATAVEFAKALAVPRPNQAAFAVKMPVSDGKHTEYMWISELSFDGQAFRGRLGNRPAALTGVKVGDELTVKVSDLSDWMYVEDNRLVGGYTLRVLRDSVSPKARARLEAQVPFRFE